MFDCSLFSQPVKCFELFFNILFIFYSSLLELQRQDYI
ncbi:hypothetical protein PH505_ct00080 [Pseudoalteromonas distincta]|nr:hypothetical protein PH505_ct00080 [Pseudoalteromonas distincta]